MKLIFDGYLTCALTQYGSLHVALAYRVGSRQRALELPGEEMRRDLGVSRPVSRALAFGRGAASEATPGAPGVRLSGGWFMAVIRRLYARPLGSTVRGSYRDQEGPNTAHNLILTWTLHAGWYA